MNKQITEKLDFNISMQDFLTVSSIFKDYINDRKEIYKDLFCSEVEYTEQDIEDYINFVTRSEGYYDEEGKVVGHPYVERLLHFFEKDYEIFVLPDMCANVEFIKSALCGDYITEESSFEDVEFDVIEKMEECWNKMIDIFKKNPLNNIDDMEYREIEGCHFYYYPTIQKYVLDTFSEFVENIAKHFPNTIMRFDSFVLVPLEQIELYAGENCYAYYTDDSVFYADSIKKDEKEFYKIILYHEFGHFIFETVFSESLQQFWFDSYEEWLSKGVKMSRDLGENYNTVEGADELFADSFAYLFADPKGEGFIERPSEIIMDTIKWLFEHEDINY